MTHEEEVQAHAAAARTRYAAMNAPVALSPAPDPYATATADGSLPAQAPVAPAPVAAPAPVVANAAAQAPVADGSPEPVPVVHAATGQRVQAASAFGVGPPSITPQEVAARGDAAGEVGAQELQTAHDNKIKAINENAKLEEDIAKEQQPIQELRQRELAQQVADEEDQQAEDAANAQKHVDLLLGYNKEISDHIANQPTDLWGRAGVNKVAGIVGLVLGGLGAAKTGHNAVVDTMNSLIEQNLKQNEYQYEMLKGKVTTENQAYAQVRATSHDKQEAADRYKIISLEQFKQQLQQAAGKFAGPQAKARADAMVAQADAELAKAHSELLQQSNKTFAEAGSLALQKRQQDLQSVQMQKDAQEGQYLPYSILPQGVKIPPSEVQQLREQQGGAAQVQDIMNDMYAAAKTGGIAAVLKNKQAAASLKVALIKQKKLSNRISKDEGAALDGMIGFLTTGNTADLLTATGSTTVPEAIRESQSQFARAWVTNLTQGYGYKPTADNPFVKAMNGDFGDNETQKTVGGPSAGGDPVAGFSTREDVARQAAMNARTKMQPAAYGGV